MTTTEKLRVAREALEKLQSNFDLLNGRPISRKIIEDALAILVTPDTPEQQCEGTCKECPAPEDCYEKAEREHLGCAFKKTGIYYVPPSEGTEGGEGK